MLIVYCLFVDCCRRLTMSNLDFDRLNGLRFLSLLKSRSKYDCGLDFHFLALEEQVDGFLGGLFL